MGTRNIRLGSMLAFDEEQESDIIQVIEELNKTHKTGRFLSNLIRIALECPEVLDNTRGKFEKGEILRQMENLGMSYNRKQFMNSVAREVEQMKNKIDRIYEMTQNMYIMSQFGKHLEIEKKTNNLLSAEFILEKQLKELMDVTGVNIKDSTYASNKLDSAHKIADDSLEYIITTYSNIVDELKSNIQYAPVVEKIHIVKEEVQRDVINEQTVKVEDKKVEDKKVEVVREEQMNDEVQSEESVIDFGSEDLSMLDNFFGS